MRTLLCVAVVAMVCFSGASVFAAPVMQFESKKFDFGEIFQGEKVHHSFPFVNAGDEPLLISRVRSSCGCTAVLASADNLEPGGKGEIQANFDSTRFRSAVSKTIYVYSNDPVYPVMQLQIKGVVRELVAVEPAQVNFGKVAGDQTLTASVLLRNQGDQPLTVGKPSTTATELRVEMPASTLAAGEELTMKITLTPKPGSARFSGYLLVPVSGVPKDQLRIPVYATIEQ